MRKVAFLVGNDTFPQDSSIPSLRFPLYDAKDLEEILGDKDSCGFETKLYLNKPSQTVLGDFEETTTRADLTKNDTILFYYSGHGILRGNDLCLVSNETQRARRGTTSIEANKVLGLLRESQAKRRVLILDCCYSGAIGTKGGDAEDTLSTLAHSFGTCILTASTALQAAKEREDVDRQKGNGVFTKALIDCLREPSKDSITVDDLYLYAFARLKDSPQTPKKLGNKRASPLKSEISSRNESNLFHIQLHFRTNA